MQPTRLVRKFRSAAFGLGILLIPAAAHAANLESMQLANELGTVLAAEEFCGFTYKQDAIAGFIERKVRADDMSFPSTLELMMSGKSMTQGSMSESAKTAHCTQIKRVAKSYGFID